MVRNTTLSVLIVLALAASSQAAVMLSHDAGTPTPGLTGFTSYTVTATSDVAGEIITGVDFYGSGADDSPTARGFFGAMNQLTAGPFTTVFGDTNPFLPQPDGPKQDSQFLFVTTGTGAVNSPAGFNGESATSLRALFSRAGGFGESVPLVQLVIPNAAAGQVSYKGTFSVLRDGVNVTTPEITGIIPIPTGGVAPNIVPIDLGEVEGAAGVIMAMLDDGPADPAATWSNLTPVAGTPALAATLGSDGKFSWDPAGSLAGKKGSGQVLYSWSATATNASGTDTDVAISLRLIPEPATMTLIGLAMVGVVGFFGRKRS